MTIENFKKDLEKFLLMNISINVGGKPKKGKLSSFDFVNHNLIFNIIRKTVKGEKKDSVVFPMPFGYFMTEDDNMVLDYKLTTLAKNDFDLMKLLVKVKPNKDSRFYDSHILITKST